MDLIIPNSPIKWALLLEVRECFHGRDWVLLRPPPSYVKRKYTGADPRAVCHDNAKLDTDVCRDMPEVGEFVGGDDYHTGARRTDIM